MKKIKSTQSENIKSEIIDVLRTLQQGYLERNLTEIDQYMEKLFCKEEDVIIIGTSDEEWFFNYDGAKELLASDWEWWGDVRFNLDETMINATEDIAWLTTTGTVKYQYDNTEKTYERWLNNVVMESYFQNDRKEYDKESLKNDFLEINWLLNHKLHDWGAEKREYLSPIRLSAVLKKIENRWIFKQMQFSFSQSFYPDMRIGNKDMQKERFEKTKEKIAKYKQNELPRSKEQVREMLLQFQKEYLDASGIELNGLIEKYFIQADNTTIIGTDNIKAQGMEKIMWLIDNQRLLWDEISIDVNEAIINEHHDIAWFATTGTIMKHLDEEAALRKQYDNVKKIMESEATSKAKLFNIRKNISITLKEIAKGEEYLWPFRLEGVLVKENDVWKFHYLQFSFPFYYILEGLREDILII